jgi:hypothetical protein
MENSRQTWRESVFMKIQKWLILLIVFALMAGTAVMLTRLKTSQKLGKPGIKTAPIPGSVAVKIDLPEHVLDFTSSNMPESEIELGYFPKDTSYARRFYQAPDGFGVNATVILMGADRTSIHRPEYCLFGQGWKDDEKTRVIIHLDDKEHHELPVMKWAISKQVQMPDGRMVEVYGLYVFWFVADNEQTTSNVQLQCYLVRDLLLSGVLQRWAYISYSAYTEQPGQVDALFERMCKLIAASVPEFQLPPSNR